jgi:lysyl-tRNA synthetase class 2
MIKDLNEIIKNRISKVGELKNDGINPYPNDFVAKNTTEEIINRFCSLKDEEIENIKEKFSLAGRIMAIRNFGKSTFIELQDRKGRIQAYIKSNIVGEESYRIFKKFDIGDFIGIIGNIFRTKTGELTINVLSLKLLSKSLRPLPEKWHGLVDIERRYRQRYLDLMVNPRVKDIFYKRSRIIQLIRKFLCDMDFLEVETPMMHPIPGGAKARPFKTYHNALNMDLYLRIAPELYLKKLVVGGIERVFELNRNFRNEGLSIHHNPEFTMLEFYMSYATYMDLIKITENMINYVVYNLIGENKFSYQDMEIDITPPWKVIKFYNTFRDYEGIDLEIFDDETRLRAFAKSISVEGEDKWDIIGKLFDKLIEPKLIQPTFVIDYPVELSPLARRKDDNPSITERFELFIGGKEIANAFSELNDPFDQRERFVKQAKQKDSVEMGIGVIDEDYLRALEFGMPPTAGEGIGIDRLIMLLTDSPSIKEVILFPQLKKED